MPTLLGEGEGHAAGCAKKALALPPILRSLRPDACADVFCAELGRSCLRSGQVQPWSGLRKLLRSSNVYASRKSDQAVVVKKPANKAELTEKVCEVAEPVERRALTERKRSQDGYDHDSVHGSNAAGIGSAR